VKVNTKKNKEMNSFVGPIAKWNQFIPIDKRRENGGNSGEQVSLSPFVSIQLNFHAA